MSLQELRISARLTIAEVCGILRVSPATLYAWERCDRKVPMWAVGLFMLKTASFPLKAHIPADIDWEVVADYRKHIFHQTVVESAEIVGCSPSEWKKYEKGTRRIKAGAFEYYVLCNLSKRC